MQRDYWCRVSIPTVSVVIVAFNEAAYFDRCLRSLASQVSAPDFEVVFVDDCSDDETSLIASRFYGRLDLVSIRNKQNLGIGGSAARGVARSSGRFVVRVDADDYVSEHFLATMFQAVSAPGALPGYRCDYLTVDAEGIPKERYDATQKPIACGIVMSRESLMSVGLYNRALRVGEDVEFEERYQKKFKIGHVPIPLYRYRQHENNSSRMRGPE